MQIKALERFWGRSLFQRRNQRLVLTEDGRLALDYAEQIFELGRDLADTLHDQPASGEYVIEVGVQHGTPRGVSHALVLAVLKHEPKARVMIRDGDLGVLQKNLNQQELDLILSGMPVQSRTEGEYTNHLIGEVPLVFAASPELARRFSKFPDDFRGAPFILPLAPHQTYQQIHDYLAYHKIVPLTVVEVQDIEVARRLAVSGVGIAPLNAYTVACNQPPGALTVLNQRGLPAMRETLYLVTRKRRRPNVLARHLEEAFRISEDDWNWPDIHR